jgi:hypothetical protein
MVVACDSFLGFVTEMSPGLGFVRPIGKRARMEMEEVRSFLAVYRGFLAADSPVPEIREHH